MVAESAFVAPVRCRGPPGVFSGQIKWVVR